MPVRTVYSDVWSAGEAERGDEAAGVGALKSQDSILTVRHSRTDPNAKPTTSWHTIFAHGDAVERVSQVPIG